MISILLLFIIASSQAFLPQIQNHRIRNSVPTENAALHLHDVSDVVSSAATTMLTHANSLWLSTIDSDIEAIPENEFATVFAGGLVG